MDHYYLRIIFEKSIKDDPGNYRGLAIGSCISKLYSSIILGRLETFVTQNKILPPNQIGFRKGCRTSDHIFLLRTLIDKTQKENKKLYAAFIDFKKAFDTVNRTKLLEMLRTLGLSHTLLLNIQALYKTTEYKIKLKNQILQSIPSNLGLKQGCPLSPLLFNIYISDIETYLKDSESSNFKLGGFDISHFLYADDLVLVANSKEGLQKKLDALATIADDKDLTINSAKSKIVFFNKSGRKYKEDFRLNGAKLDTVQSYTYLGIDMKASGSFTSSIQELISKAKKAMIPLYKTIMQFKIPFRNALNLFKTFVEPIVLYNSENWSSMTAKNIDKCKLDPTALHNIALNSQTTACQLKFY